MNLFSLSRWALSVCAAILFAGCSQTNSTLPRSNAGTPSTRLGQLAPVALSPGRGGAFSGGYSGTIQASACTRRAPRGGGSHGGAFAFTGAGAVKFLGPSKESGYLIAVPPGCDWTGGVTLTSSRHPEDQIDIGVKGGYGVSPCAQWQSYSVAGGTGKFSNATGSGKVKFRCRGGPSGKYRDKWSGTLSY